MLFVITRSVDLSEFIDLGRRKGTYADTGMLNANFYLVTFATYGSIFVFLWSQSNQEGLSEWFHFVLILFIIATSLTFVNEAAARLMYICVATMTILLAQYARTDNGRLALFVWLISLFISHISNYYHDDDFQDSMIARYYLILSSS